MTQTSRFVSAMMIVSLCLISCVSQSVRSQAKGEFEIPFTFTAHNHIVVKVVLNKTDAFNLMLHTAASDVFLTEEAVRQATAVKFKEAAKLESWGGQSNARYSTGNYMQIGGMHWDGIKVWEDKNSGIGTDGKFGLDLFQGRVIEIDFERERLTVTDQLPAKAKQYQRLPLENEDGNLFVEARCLIGDTSYPNRFLLHSGYSGGLLLDDDFVTKNGLDGKLSIIEESSLKDSFGNTIKVKKATLPTLMLDNTPLQNVATGFFSGTIGRQKMSVLGGDVLKRFNLIFDLKNNSLYVKARN